MNIAYTPIVRAVIQVLAGFLAKHGFDIGSDVEPIAAAVVTAGTLAWSVYEKNKIKKDAQ